MELKGSYLAECPRCHTKTRW